MEKNRKPRDWHRYKQKECPVCKKIHRGKYKYCSIVCSNKGRTITNKHKAKTSETMLKYYQTPEGITTRYNRIKFNKGILKMNIDDIDIIPPVFDIDFDYF